MKETIKKMTMVAAVALLACFAASAADIVRTTSSPVVSSAGTWTNSVAAGTIYTNVTRIDCTGFRTLRLQFTQAANGASTSNVVWQLARNVDGSTVTNKLGLGGGTVGANMEFFASVTNTLINGLAPSTTCITLGDGYAGVDPGTGNAHTLSSYVYIWSVTIPTGSTALTNYSVYASGL